MINNVSNVIPTNTAQATQRVCHHTASSSHMAAATTIAATAATSSEANSLVLIGIISGNFS